MLVMIFTGFLIGIGSGVNILAARFLGAKQDKDLHQTVHTAFALCFIFGILLCAVGILFARPMLELLNTKDELIEGAVLYLKIYFAGLPAMAMYNFGNGVLSAAGDTKRPLYFMILAGIINITLNLIFVICFKMDVAGVALATIIAQYISAILILITLIKTKDVFTLKLSSVCIVKDKAMSLLILGIPAGLQNAIFYIANLFVQAGVNSFSATVVSGNSAASNADGLVYYVMMEFYVACSSFIGQNYGAMKKDRILKSYLISTGYAFLAGVVLGGLLIVFDTQFLSIFTSDTAVIKAGLERLHVMSISYAFSAFMDGAIAASRGLGKSLAPTIIVIMGSCVFRIAWIFTVFAYFNTITSLYLLYFFSWTITAVAATIYFSRCYKKALS